MRRQTGLLNAFVAAAVFFLVGGCAGSFGDFFSTRYQNVSGYFNTYYNASRAFKEAEAEVLAERKRLQPENFFAPYAAPPAARTKFATVIEKSSRLIQFYPRSKWVDRAIMMIGKSYLYQNDLLLAQRKFIELLEIFPRSPLRFEARLALARTYYLIQLHQSALDVLSTLPEEALRAKERDIAIEALMMKARIHFQETEYARAAELYAEAVAIRGDRNLRSWAQFQRAKCYENDGLNERSAQAYLAVLDYKPDFSLEFAARLNAAVLLGKANKYEESHEILRRLRGELLTPDQKSRVELEIANLYHQKGELDLALDFYDMIDTVYRRTDAAAHSFYQRGIMFEHRFKNLAEAKQYYDLATTEFPQSEVVQPSRERSQVLGRYLSHRTELARYDSLLHLILFPPEIIEEPDTLDQSVEPSGDEESVGEKTVASKSGTVQAPPLVTIPLDTIHARRAANQFGIGVVFLLDINWPDSAEYWFNTLLSEYPESELAPRALYALAEVYRVVNDSERVELVYDRLLTRYPESDYARQVAVLRGKKIEPDKGDVSDSLYLRAEGYLLAGETKLAIATLEQLLRQDTSSATSARARYTLGWIYENIEVNNESAIFHYRELVQHHPSSAYAGRVRPKLASVEAAAAEQQNDAAPPKQAPPDELKGEEYPDDFREPDDEPIQPRRVPRKHEFRGGDQEDPELEGK